MQNLKREYLVPEVEVLELALQGVIAQSGNIEDSGENPVICRSINSPDYQANPQRRVLDYEHPSSVKS